MENTKTITTTTDTPVKEFQSGDLLMALYWIWDAFERSNMPYFLVHQTAKDAKAQRDLTGDKVEVGVRLMEWVSGGRRIFDSFVGEPLEENSSRAIYSHNGVPVIVNIYEDSECITNTDSIVYRNEGFRLPNTIEKFEEIYDTKPS